MESVEKCLRENRLRVLRLSHVATSSPQLLDRLFAAFRASSCVAVLDLRDAHLGNAGCLTLSKILHDKPHIEHIDVSGNDIGPAGFLALVNAVVTQPSQADLRALIADNNPLGDKGGAAITMLLRSTRHNPQLLSLAHCDVSDRAVADVASALRINISVKVLRLEGNRISGVGATALKDMLTINKTLTEVTLSNNPIPPHLADEIALALKTRKAKTPYAADIAEIYTPSPTLSPSTDRSPPLTRVVPSTRAEEQVRSAVREAIEREFERTAEVLAVDVPLDGSVNDSKFECPNCAALSSTVSSLNSSMAELNKEVAARIDELREKEARLRSSTNEAAKQLSAREEEVVAREQSLVEKELHMAELESQLRLEVERDLAAAAERRHAEVDKKIALSLDAARHAEEFTRSANELIVQFFNSLATASKKFGLPIPSAPPLPTAEGVRVLDDLIGGVARAVESARAIKIKNEEEQAALEELRTRLAEQIVNLRDDQEALRLREAAVGARENSIGEREGGVALYEDTLATVEDELAEGVREAKERIAGEKAAAERLAAEAAEAREEARAREDAALRAFESAVEIKEQADKKLEEVERRRVSNEEAEAELNAKSSKLAAATAHFQQLERSLEAKRREAAEERRGVGVQMDALAQERAKLAALKDEILAAQRASDAAARLAAARMEELARVEESVILRESIFGEREHSTQGQLAAMRVELAALEEKKASIHALFEDVKRREEAVILREAAAEAKESRLTELDATLRFHAEEIERTSALVDEFAKRREEMRVAEDAFAAREENLKNRERELTDAARDSDDLRQRLTAESAAVASDRARLEALERAVAARERAAEEALGVAREGVARVGEERVACARDVETLERLRKVLEARESRAEEREAALAAREAAASDTAAMGAALVSAAVKDKEEVNALRAQLAQGVEDLRRQREEIDAERAVVARQLEDLRGFDKRQLAISTLELELAARDDALKIAEADIIARDEGLRAAEEGFARDRDALDQRLREITAEEHKVRALLDSAEGRARRLFLAESVLKKSISEMRALAHDVDSLAAFSPPPFDSRKASASMLALQPPPIRRSNAAVAAAAAHVDSLFRDASLKATFHNLERRLAHGDVAAIEAATAHFIAVANLRTSIAFAAKRGGELPPADEGLDVRADVEEAMAALGGLRVKVRAWMGETVATSSTEDADVLLPSLKGLLVRLG